MDEQEIESLIERYVNGSATSDEVVKLKEWYNAAEVDDVTWPVPGDDRELLYNRMLNRLKGDMQPHHARTFTLSKVKVAASILIAVGIAAIAFLMLPPRSVEYVVVDNKEGKIRLVQLPDSSKVWLNARTRVSYHPSFASHRNVVLDGEAYFEVTKDPEHPFIIASGPVNTTVTGTSFNINAYAGDTLIEVSVLTGKVEVSDQTKQLALLTATRSIKYNLSNSSVVLSEVDTADAVSWMRGRFQFKGEDLQSISNVLERWYGYNITFDQPATANCKYYMSFSQQDSFEGILAAITQLTGLTYELDGHNKKVVFYGNACN